MATGYVGAARHVFSFSQLFRQSGPKPGRGREEGAAELMQSHEEVGWSRAAPRTQGGSPRVWLASAVKL